MPNSDSTNSYVIAIKEQKKTQNYDFVESELSNELGASDFCLPNDWNMWNKALTVGPAAS